MDPLCRLIWNVDQSVGWEVWIVPKGTAVEDRAKVSHQHFDIKSFGDICPETRPEIYFNYVGKFTLMVMDKNGTLVSQNDFRARNGASGATLPSTRPRSAAKRWAQLPRRGLQKISLR